METESCRLLQTEMLRPVSCKTAHNGEVGTCVLLCHVALRLQQKHDVIYKCCMLQCDTDSNQFLNQHVTMYVSVWPVIESHKNSSTVLMFNLDTERTMWKCIQCRKYFFFKIKHLLRLKWFPQQTNQPSIFAMLPDLSLPEVNVFMMQARS